MSREDILKYGSLIFELIRSRNAKPVIYESPIAKAALYPEKFEKFHADNLISRKQQIFRSFQVLRPG